LNSEFGVGFKTRELESWWHTEMLVQAKVNSQINTPLKSAGLRAYPLGTGIITLSAGYKEKFKIGSEIRGYVSSGIGISLENVTFDYGFDTTEVFAQENQHYFSMSIKY
ncbi:hypothetical protein EBR96_07710, partial [bacterium]|nr:hypothetical protein [bacterium]